MRSFLSFAAILAALVLNAQSTPDEMMREFFSSYSAGKRDKALDDLYSHSPWIKAKSSDDIINLKQKINSFADIAGEYRGYSLLGTSAVQTDLVIYDYMVKYDRQPLRFRFEFYRPDKEWIVFAFSFDDDLDDELEEVVKRSYYQP